MQSRLGSFVEACMNVLIGFWINFAANFLIFPLFGWQLSLSDNLKVGAIYTAISIARGYAIRRWFNRYIHRASLALTGEHDAK